MKKIAFAAVLIVLSVVFEARGELSPRAAALDAEIKRMQQQLQETVEAFNDQVEKDASESTVIESKEITPTPTQTPLPQPASASKEISLEERVKILEQELKAIKEAKPTDGARTPEEAAATKKANETAPLLATDTPAVAQYNQALALFENNELDKAAEAFEQILKDYPNDLYAHKAQAHLGEIYRKLGKMEEAEKAYSLALTNHLELPIMIECRLGLAETFIALNKFKLACDQLKIIQKESIDASQKKRLQEALGKGLCQK